MTDIPDKIVYTANATVTGGREGSGRTDDGKVDVTLTAPQEMGGAGTGTNPEQLFAVGYGACFSNALGLVAKRERVDVSGSSTDVSVGIGRAGKSFALTVEITATIPGVDDATAQQLVDAAHEVCPYSRATRGNIDVTVTGKAA